MDRERRFDALKGVGILMVVLAHAGCWDPIWRYINLFHMAVFFVCAGWFYKVKIEDCCNLQSLCKYICRRFSRLWFSYVAWCGFCLLVWNLCFEFNIYSDNPAVVSRFTFSPINIADLPKKLFNVFLMRDGDVGLAGTCWFLRSMFISLCCYRIVDYFISLLRPKWRLYIQSTVACTLLVLSRERSSSMLAYFFIHLGVLIRCLDLDIMCLKKRAMVFVGVLCSASLVAMLPIENVSFGSARFVSLPTIVIAGLCGWYAILAFVSVLPSWCEKNIAYVGVHSLPIMLFHFLAFKLVSLIGVLMYGENLFMIGKFPILYTGFFWCLFYTIVGVSVPLVFNAFWERVYNLLKNGVANA